jgi:2',3'-cyclic-nucleotide 2'-phosphodiesterase
VGKPGRAILTDILPRLKADLRLDFVMVNAENAADNGFGLTQAVAAELFEAGADCLTLGNHSFDQREALSFITHDPRILRPCNYPPLTQAPGRGANLFQLRDASVLVVSVMGRLFMDALDCPYSAVEREVSACPLGLAADAILVDVHAEASSEKQGIGHFLDGRVSLVSGTHTHVPTADHRILAGGTGYITDVGMCGDYDSVIGMRKDISVRRQSIRLPGPRVESATGRGMACGILADISPQGLCTRIQPVRLGTGLDEAIPG